MKTEEQLIWEQYEDKENEELQPWQVLKKATQSYPPKRIPELEHILFKDPMDTFYYVRDVIGHRFPPAENILKTNFTYATLYSRQIIQGRWEEAEKIIATSPRASELYAEVLTKEETLDFILKHNITYDWVRDFYNQYKPEWTDDESDTDIFDL